MKKFFVVLMVLVSISSFGKSKTIILGIPPWGGSSTEMQNKFDPLAEYLSEKLEKNVKMATTSDYEELGYAVSQGFIDIGIFPSSSYVSAKNKHRDAILYICTAKDLKSGKAFYESNIVVKKDKNISSYEDLKNKIVGFVDEKSSSGYKFPIAHMISQWEIEPNSYFKKIVFLGSHPNVLTAINSDMIDAGAMGELLNTSRLAKLDEEDFVVLDRIKNIPLDAIAVSGMLNKKTREKIKNALLQLTINSKTKSGKNIFSKSGITWAGFEARDDSFYDIIRKTNHILGIYNK